MLSIFKEFKKIYWPIIFIYFAAGFAALDAVTWIFLKKDFFTFSAPQWITISIFASLPWSIKLVYSAFIDSFSLFGNRRKSYIALGAVLMAIGNFGILDILQFHLLDKVIDTFSLLSLSAFLISSGIVISDIVADTLCVELVEKTDDILKYQKDLGTLAVFSRMAQIIGGVAAASITGYLAKHFSATQVYLVWFIIPIVTFLGTVTYKPVRFIAQTNVDKRIFISSMLFGIAILAINFIFESELAQIYMFFLSLMFVTTLMFTLVRHLPKSDLYTFAFAVIAVFCFRVVPSPSEPTQWWMANGLHFDEAFFGHLRLTSTIAGFLVLIGASNFIRTSSIRKTLIILSIADLALNLPIIGVYYGWHETLGLSAKTVMLLDTAAASPVGNLAMIPLSVLLAQYTPDERRATYTAVTASFVNIALMAGDLISRKLAKEFIVTPKDFSRLGHLLVISLLVSIIFNLVGISIINIRKKDVRNNQ